MPDPTEILTFRRSTPAEVDTARRIVAMIDRLDYGERLELVPPQPRAVVDHIWQLLPATCPTKSFRLEHQSPKLNWLERILSAIIPLPLSGPTDLPLIAVVRER